MTSTDQTPESDSSPVPRFTSGTLFRVARYAVVRLLVLGVMVLIAVFVAVVVLNYGGYIDKIVRGRIDEALMYMGLGMKDATPEQLVQATEQARAAMEEAAGLNQPFLLRCVRWTGRALAFDWGQARMLRAPLGLDSQRAQVGQIILQALPNTLLVAGTANLILFFSTLFLALRLSQKHGSFWDRAIIALSPLSAIPNWILGIVLVLIFSVQLNLLPVNGMFDALPPTTRLGYVPVVLRHMILPVAAIFLSLFFQSVYVWRTLFMVHAGEDYVEMATAQGLPQRSVERNYILRPVLPYIITSFTVMLISFWQGAIVLEVLFQWPGIGQLFFKAIQYNESAVSTGLVVCFALLLAVCIFLLDIVYALVDPRVTIEGRGHTLRPAAWWRRPLSSWLPRRRGPRLPPAPVLVPSPTRSAGIEAAKPDPLAARRRGPSRARSWLEELARHPPAVAGLVIILALVAVSGYALIAIPPAKAVELWREQDPARYQVPAKAQPVWTNLWRREKLPPTIVLDSGGGRAEKLVGPFVQGTGHITLTYIVDYPYGGFPRNVLLHFRTRYAAKKPFATLTWLTSDGREFDLGRFAVGADQVYDASKDMPQKYFTRDTRMEGLLQGVGGNPASQVLFADPSSATPVAVKGRYALRASVLTFEPGTDVDADLLVEGQVYGMAGTDDKRRDLSVALLWGAPVALAFGLLGAVATSLISMLIAGTGAWFGGWLDGLVQRITEVNMLLPVLPMAMMVFYLYSASIWGVLGVLVLLGIFGSSIKSYRSLFLQIREAPYIEAAQAYGAGHGRIIARYLVPRMVPLLIPQLVILVPTYVCFEATLAFLGVSDPKLPTWGKLIYDAVTHGSVQAQPYWVLEPTMLIVATALAFAMLGYALDSILNPRLRSV